MGHWEYRVVRLLEVAECEARLCERSPSIILLNKLHRSAGGTTNGSRGLGADEVRGILGLCLIVGYLCDRARHSRYERPIAWRVLSPQEVSEPYLESLGC